MKQGKRNRKAEYGMDRYPLLSPEQRRAMRRKRRRQIQIQRLAAAVLALVLLGSGAAVIGSRVLLSPDSRTDLEDGGTRQAAKEPEIGDGEETENGSGSGPDTEVSPGEDRARTESETPELPETEYETEPPAAAVSLDLSGIYSSYALLIDRASGAVIGEKNSRERIYPASMTKIMTAILAIEQTEDLSASVTLPYEIYDSLYAEGASMAGFEPGEPATWSDLLYGILLPSGAECCVTFADRISGSEEAFAGLMNQKAAELGMTDTHFRNSTGLHDPDHYSTAADIAALLRYALDNPTFREVFTSSRHSVPPTVQHPEGFTFFSTMFRYMDSAAVTGGEILGGKTGYTEEAGQCLASLASVNGAEYILVTAKAEGSHETEQFHILDAQNIYSRLGEATL